LLGRTAAAATEAIRCCRGTLPEARWPATRGLKKFVATALSVAFIAGFAPCADARESLTPGDAAAGRAFALSACTGCHIVSADQPFAPVFTGPPPPLDFRSIANKPDTTAASLRKFLSTLRTVPLPGHMADPDLTAEERENVIAFIMTLQVHR